ncbi:MAG TPA: phosphoribosylanthranilate isomerase [Blastocatellia bacterium]|jgi:phosphoribosylanthranilate isomerase|nr:phosphoribosylanthranilate isomerase [Blastocatellia bacterium]
MTRVRVKVCGVRSLPEARAAIDAGADAIGFNFWRESPRYIEPAEAHAVIASLPPFVSRVGVFVNEEADHIEGIATSVGLDAIQLHGDETRDFCRRLRLIDKLKGVAFIKAVRVETEADVEGIWAYPVGAILLDSKKRGAYGGTGERFDWRLAVRAAEFAPIILAGGLKVENVREAIGSVRPFAVDVCSGVESSPGVKDFGRMRAFIAEVEKANRDD